MLRAGNAIVGRAVRGGIPPFTHAFGRWSLALALLAPFSIRPVVADWRIARRHWRAILFLGLFGVAAFNGLLYSGLRHSTATNGLLLQALIPALVLLTGALAFGDRVPFGQAGGVPLGVAVIVFHGEVGAILELKLGYGDALILFGCIAWPVYTACLSPAPIQPLSFIFLTFCIGAIVMAPLAFADKMDTPIVWHPHVLAAFGYVAVFPSICAYFLYNAAVAQIGAGPAGQTISLMPVFGALLAAQLLGEELQTHHAVGIAMVMGGIALAWVLGSRFQRSPEPSA